VPSLYGLPRFARNDEFYWVLQYTTQSSSRAVSEAIHQNRVKANLLVSKAHPTIVIASGERSDPPKPGTLELVNAKTGAPRVTYT